MNISPFDQVKDPHKSHGKTPGFFPVFPPSDPERHPRQAREAPRFARVEDAGSWAILRAVFEAPDGVQKKSGPMGPQILVYVWYRPSNFWGSRVANFDL